MSIIMRVIIIALLHVQCMRAMFVSESKTLDIDFFHLLKGGKSFASDCLLCASTWLIFELFLTIF